MKRVTTFILAFVLLAALVLFPAQSASAASNNFSYRVIYFGPNHQSSNNFVSDLLNRLYTMLDNRQGNIEAPAPTQEPTPEPTQPPAPQPTPEPQPTETPYTGYQLSADEQRMVNLVNSERQRAGLSALKVDLELSRVARIKSQDMRDNNYFSHTSPTYGSPFDMMRSFGVSYRTAGENIALHGSVESAHNGLMNSDGHRANILNPNFTHIGIGIVDGRYYTQMFIGR